MLLWDPLKGIYFIININGILLVVTRLFISQHDYFQLKRMKSKHVTLCDDHQPYCISKLVISPRYCLLSVGIYIKVFRLPIKQLNII